MKKTRFSEEQIIAVLREQEGGMKTADVCRKHGISSATLYAWKVKYGGMDVSPAGGERKRGAKDQALGRSRGGLTTKVHMLADAPGRPLRLIITAGQVGDITQAPALLDGQTGDAVLAAIGADVVIPSNRCRKLAIPHDRLAYKHRNRIERCFSRLRHFRRFATRYDRRTIHFAGFAHLAATMIWLR